VVESNDGASIDVRCVYLSITICRQHIQLVFAQTVAKQLVAFKARSPGLSFKSVDLADAGMLCACGSFLSTCSI
jgi:hypothetical protein